MIRIITNFWESACFDGDGGGGGGGGGSPSGATASGASTNSGGLSSGTNVSLPGAMRHARGDLVSGFGSVVGRAAQPDGYGQQAGFTSGASVWSGGAASYAPPQIGRRGPSMSGATFDIPSRTSNAGNVARSSLPPEFAAGYQQFAAEQVGKPSYTPAQMAEMRGRITEIATAPAQGQAATPDQGQAVTPAQGPQQATKGGLGAAMSGATTPIPNTPPSNVYRGSYLSGLSNAELGFIAKSRSLDRDKAQAQLNAREAAALYGRTRSARSGSAMPPARGLDRTDLASMPPAGTFNARAGMWSSPPAIAGQVYGLDEEGQQTAPASMTAAFDNPNQSLNTPAFNAGLQAYYDSNVTAMANPSRGGLNSARSDFTTVQQPALTPADRRAAEDMSFQSYQLTYGSLPSLPGRENMPPSRAQMNAYDQFVATILSGEANKTGNPYESVVGNRTAVDVFGKPLGRMTIAEVEAAQKAMAPHPTLNSKALGAYQFVTDTLSELTTKTGTDKSLPMNQAVQDFLGLARTQQRADRATKNGKIDVDKFAVELSKEFAALANPKTGISYYAKDRVNKASIPAEQTMALAKSLVESGVVVPGRSISEMGKKANQAIANPAAQRSAPYGGTLGRTAPAGVSPQPPSPAPAPAGGQAATKQAGQPAQRDPLAGKLDQSLIDDPLAGIPPGYIYGADDAPANPVAAMMGPLANNPNGLSPMNQFVNATVGLMGGLFAPRDGSEGAAPSFVGTTGDGERVWNIPEEPAPPPAPASTPPAVNVVEASRRFVNDYLYPPPPVKWPARQLTFQT